MSHALAQLGPYQARGLRVSPVEAFSALALQMVLLDGYIPCTGFHGWVYVQVSY